MPLKSMFVIETELASLLKALVFSTVFDAVGCLTPVRFLFLFMLIHLSLFCLSYVI